MPSARACTPPRTSWWPSSGPGWPTAAGCRGRRSRWPGWPAGPPCRRPSSARPGRSISRTRSPPSTSCSPPGRSNSWRSRTCRTASPGTPDAFPGAAQGLAGTGHPGLVRCGRPDGPRIGRVRFLRPQEIPTYIEQGLFDFGITGRDWISETGADVVSLGELQYSKVTADPVRVVLAVPASSGWETIADLPEGIRISTELPALTRRFLDANGIKATVIPSYGATEAKVPDIVDAIVDLTETGSSLRRNGLKILHTLLTSYTELVANPAAYADEAKRAAMEDVALLLRGAIMARGSVLLKLNVAASELAAVTEILPAMTSPTITSLARGDMSAVEAVVPKRGVNTLIPALRAAGARDILEIPISKIVE